MTRLPFRLPAPLAHPRMFYDRLRGSLLTVPLALVAAGFGLALGTVQIDRAITRAGNTFAFTGGPQSAREVLSAIASTMLSFTGLVFSVTIVTLQLTSSQFSPRALRNFLRDPISQSSLGVFLATFVYALTVLREVRGSDGLVDRFVPGIAITIAFVLVGLSVVLFVGYIHHIAQSIRAVSIIGRIGAETRRSIDRVMPDELDSDHPGPGARGHGGLDVEGGRMVAAPRSGVVQLIDGPVLARVAAKADLVVAVLVGVGEFVPEGAPLLRVAPADPAGRARAEDRSARNGDGRDRDQQDQDRERQDRERQDRELSRTVVIGDERTMEGDPGFGLRQLVDIAERALSPGINDPTTAVQCIDQIHALLRRIAGRAEPESIQFDDDGRPRVLLPVPTWESLVHLAFDEIRHWGASSLQVRRRLRHALDDLADVAGPDRLFPVTEQLRQLDLAAPAAGAGVG
ncbi:MAG: DUF2254 domain-containing protein [Acidimicrobiales bacterium]